MDGAIHARNKQAKWRNGPTGLPTKPSWRILHLRSYLVEESTYIFTCVRHIPVKQNGYYTKISNKYTVNIYYWYSFLLNMTYLRYICINLPQWLIISFISTCEGMFVYVLMHRSRTVHPNNKIDSVFNCFYQFIWI